MPITHVVEVIPYSSEYPDDRARQLWLLLFDIYRSEGCDINRVYDLLCDLKTLEKMFGEVESGELLDIQWSCKPDSDFTELTTDIEDPRPPNCITVHVELWSDRMTVKRLS